MSVLEAWSYRLAVLMTDHCNLPEGFAHNAAIRIGTDVESIAEGMRSLIRFASAALRPCHSGFAFPSAATSGQRIPIYNRSVRMADHWSSISSPGHKSPRR